MSLPGEVSGKPRAEQQAPPWHQAYPPPTVTDPPSVSRQELLQLFREGKVAGRDFVLVDLRRNDHEVSEEHDLFSCKRVSLWLIFKKRC